MMAVAAAAVAAAATQRVAANLFTIKILFKA